MTNFITETGALFKVLARMTIQINKRFRVYPEAGPVPKAPDVLLLGSVDILIKLVQCSGLKADTVQMFVVQMPSKSRRSSRLQQLVGVVAASSHADSRSRLNRRRDQKVGHINPG